MLVCMLNDTSRRTWTKISKDLLCHVCVRNLELNSIEVLKTDQELSDVVFWEEWPETIATPRHTDGDVTDFLAF